MSADSKKPGSASLAIEPAERRDTLRGVGDATRPPPTPEAPADDAHRLRQEEFTVPPQLWRRPPSGWFRQFARAAAPKPGDGEPAPPPSEGEATPEQAGTDPSTRASARWLPWLIVALVALVSWVGWRALGTAGQSATAPTSTPERPSAGATASVLELPPAAAPPASSGAPALPGSSGAAPAVQEPTGATRTSAPSASSTPALPSSTHGPIY